MKVRIKPEFYNQIKNGKKTIEYRKIKSLRNYAFSTNLITFVNTETKEQIIADIDNLEIKKVEDIDISKMTSQEMGFLADYYKNERYGVLIHLGKIN